jgi:hypothetical protein
VSALLSSLPPARLTGTHASGRALLSAEQVLPTNPAMEELYYEDAHRPQREIKRTPLKQIVPVGWRPSPEDTAAAIQAVHKAWGDGGGARSAGDASAHQQPSSSSPMVVHATVASPAWSTPDVRKFGHMTIKQLETVPSLF